MTSIQELLDFYTSKEQYGIKALQGVAFVAKDGTGKTIDSAASGLANFPKDGEAGKPMQTDSTGFIASMTKLVTSIAVLQAVEHGKLSLDEDLGKYVPELANLQVFEGVDSEGKAILVKQNKSITMRHLLTHTSGIVYHSLSPKLQQYFASVGRPPSQVIHTTMEEITNPLIFQPGEAWAYGPGIDWAGYTLEVVTGETLELYMHKNIFEILGMDSTTFHPYSEGKTSVLRRLLDFGWRSPDGSLVAGPLPNPVPNPICSGGGGLFSSADDYIKLLFELLSGGSKLLSPETIKLVLEPQLDPKIAKAMLASIGETAAVAAILRPSWSAEDEGSHSLASSINLHDIPGRRRAGTVSWTGVSNVHWWVDRKTGICATLFTQVFPPGDAVVLELLDKVERHLYSNLSQQ